MDYQFFYQELIQSWHKICDTEPTQPSEILRQSVWNERFILCKRDSFSTTNLTAKILEQCMTLRVKTINSYIGLQLSKSMVSQEKT